VVVVALVLWCLVSYQRFPVMGGPLTRQLKPLATTASVVLAFVALLLALGVVSGPVQTAATLSVASAAGAASLARVVRSRRAGAVRAIVVGDLMEIARWLEAWKDRSDLEVVGAVLVEPETDTDILPRDLIGVPVCLSLGELPARVESWQADLVAFAPGFGLSQSDVRRAAWSLQDSRASIAVVGLFDAVAPHRITPGVVGGETLCEIEAPRRSRLLVALKHVADRAAAAVLLVLFAPVLAAMALVIRLDSRGPAVFKQTRIGLNGAPFTVYKMRTMVTDAEEIKHRLAQVNEYDGVLFKIRRDPRVTRVGHFLRRSSLDELPQLLNVLRGEMSLVGPRPFLPSETAEMTSDSLRRLAVKPGITGLWQVSGRSDLGWDESVALDTYYADNWTLGGDAEIAVRTVSAVLGAKGAY
jgi:exopolysaccharide biosynthesis polyprenyl glycosylphosphotransferase